MFRLQFFGKVALSILLAALLVHAVAIPMQHQDTPSAIALGVMFVATAIITWRSLAAGMYIAFAEIMMGGHGHLLETHINGFALSLRVVIFAAVMMVWGVQFLLRRATPRLVGLRDGSLLLLLVAVAIAGIVGFVANVPGNAFDDMNGYLTLFYALPMLSITWTQERKRDLLQVLVASGLWVAITTLLILFLFTHLPGWQLHDVYAYVRDSRLAEVTLLTGPTWFINLLPAACPWYFRVFEPAQFFVMVLLFVLVAAWFVLWRDQKVPRSALAMFVVCAAAFIAGWSRSFFIGAFAGAITALVALYVHAPRPLSRHVRTLAQLAACTVIAGGLFWAVIAFPFPKHPDLRQAAFYRETTDDTRDLAVSSRWNLLEPMFTEIMRSPILGRGFGTEVTFISDDPRVRDMNPSGEWTTYRFEWGYQDIWLKMGLLGLIAFVTYGVTVGNAFLYTYRTQESRWLTIGLFSGVVALFATHIFSPYLNHPIGLGYMLFVLPFFDWRGTAAEMAKHDGERKEQHAPLSAPALPVAQRANSARSET